MSRASDAAALREALMQLLAASDAEASQAAYHQTLDAIGHDHSGSLHRSALPAVEDILAVALDGKVWAADGALDVLIEVATSFDLDPTIARDETEVRRFRANLLAAVARRRHEIGQLAMSAAHQQTRQRARELVEVVLYAAHPGPAS